MNQLDADPYPGTIPHLRQPLVVLGVLCQGAVAAAQDLTPLATLLSASPGLQGLRAECMEEGTYTVTSVSCYTGEKLISAVSSPFAGLRFSTEYECNDQMCLKAPFQAACGGS